MHQSPTCPSARRCTNNSPAPRTAEIENSGWKEFPDENLYVYAIDENECTCTVKLSWNTMRPDTHHDGSICMSSFVRIHFHLRPLHNTPQDLVFCSRSLVEMQFTWAPSSRSKRITSRETITKSIAPIYRWRNLYPDGAGWWFFLGWALLGVKATNLSLGVKLNPHCFRVFHTKLWYSV